MANVGLPGTSGFVGEFMALIGTFKANIQVATIATLGVILSAAYALWLYRKMIFGKLKPSLAGIRDIGWREAVIFAPLVALTILFGVAPKPVLDMSAASVAQLLEGYNKGVAAANAADQTASVRGTREAGEAGTQKQAMQTLALESGSALSARPGMTGAGIAQAQDVKAAR
jgi:formate hydrogenlyase subunit 3/multisubunit Na+/H+ antiporter MnhD subunit